MALSTSALAQAPAAEAPAAETPAARPPESSAAQAASPPAAAVEPPPTTSASGEPLHAPGAARNLVEGQGDGGWNLLWIPRVILYVPRYLLEIPFYPIRGIAWAYERYNIALRLTDVFFNDARTFGVYPVLLAQSGFGLNVGARVVHRDLLGRREGFSLLSAFGGRFQQRHRASLHSGQRFGRRLRFTLLGGYTAIANGRFFGLGNNTTLTPPELTNGPINPLEDDTAVDTRFREEVVTWEGQANLKLARGLTLRVRHHWRHERFDEGVNREPERLLSFYDEAGLVGHNTDLFSNYNEVALTLRTLRPSTPFISQAAPSTGWFIVGFAGHAYGVQDDPSNFVRTGVDVQRYFDLYNGDRVLIFRGFLDGILGDDDTIPFVDYPALGGAQFLRGYPQDRFRDRVAGLLGVEYQYPMNSRISGYLFGESGRVFHGFRDLTFDDWRASYGGGVEIRSSTSFLMRFQVAASTENDVQLVLTFSPTSDPRARF